MEIVDGLPVFLVVFILLRIDPSVLQFTPREDRQHRIVVTVQEDELARFSLDDRNPVAPLEHTEQRRDPASQMPNKFTSRRFGLMPPDHHQITAEGACGPGQLNVIGPVKRSCARDPGECFLFGKYPQSNQRVFQREGSALPEVWLWVNAHFRGVVD